MHAYNVQSKIAPSHIIHCSLCNDFNVMKPQDTRKHLIFTFTISISVVVCSTCWQKKTEEWNWLSELIEFSLNSMFSFNSNLSTAQTPFIQTDYSQLMALCIGISIVELAIWISCPCNLFSGDFTCYRWKLFSLTGNWIYPNEIYVFTRYSFLPAKIIDCSAGRNWVWGSSCEAPRMSIVRFQRNSNIHSNIKLTWIPCNVVSV